MELPASGRLQDAPSWNAVMTACQAAAQWRVALGIYSDARARGRLPPSRLALLSACERGSAWRAALQIFAHGGEAVEKAAATTMTACSRMLQWELSLGLLAEVRSARIRPDARSLTAGIAACERGRRWVAALALFAELAAADADDIVALNAVLGALAGHWRLALLLASPRMDMAMEGTYHAILGALETSSRWWQAIHLFHAGRREGRCGIVGLNSACSSLEKAIKWELVLSLLQGSVGRDVISYTALLAACSRAMRWQQALAFREATGLLGAALLSAAAQLAGHCEPLQAPLPLKCCRDQCSSA
ncbi:EMB2076 [Symbiodinium sp. CCMP2592]|nr:EMB2076 [Symbiodinium sp. CCMP2592]